MQSEIEMLPKLTYTLCLQFVVICTLRISLSKEMENFPELFLCPAGFPLVNETVPHFHLTS